MKFMKIIFIFLFTINSFYIFSAEKTKILLMQKKKQEDDLNSLNEDERKFLQDSENIEFFKVFQGILEEKKLLQDKPIKTKIKIAMNLKNCKLFEKNFKKFIIAANPNAGILMKRCAFNYYQEMIRRISQEIDNELRASENNNITQNEIVSDNISIKKKKKKKKSKVNSQQSKQDILKKPELEEEIDKSEKEKNQKEVESQKVKVESQDKQQSPKTSPLVLQNQVIKFFTDALYKNDFHSVQNTLKHTNENLKKLLINLKIPINQDKFCTPLELAIKRDYTEIVKLLIEHGADYNSTNPDFYNWTPLHIAVWNHRVNIVRILLNQKDLKYNEHDICGYTPLHLAASNAYTKVNHSIDRLLASEDKECKEIGQILSEFTEIVDLIIKNRADSDVFTKIEDSKDQFTAIHIATIFGNLKTIKLLKGFYDINIETSTMRFTLFHLACASQNLEVIEFLLSNNATFNARTTAGTTCVHIAANLNNLKVIKYLEQLIKQNRNVLLMKNNKGKTAFDIANEKGYKDLAEYLSSL